MKSVDSTRHITKAMELVASSKIKKACTRMEQSKFYRDTLLDAFAALATEKGQYSEQRDKELPVVYIVVAGDRGLAGGYNSNVFRSAMTMIRENDIVLPIGKRAVEHYKTRAHCLSDVFTSAESFKATECAMAAGMIRDLWDKGEISAVFLIYTKFESMLSQSPDGMYLLPLGADRREIRKNGPVALVEYEPSPEEVLRAVIPEYLAGVMYSAVCESFAAELAARRSAMDTATKNADEMLGELSLSYNRARQGAITQEITEIVAGANAGI